VHVFSHLRVPSRKCFVISSAEAALLGLGAGQVTFINI
jgi:hypothetical protein